MGSYARLENYLTTLEVETCPEFWPPSPVSGPLCVGATETYLRGTLCKDRPYCRGRRQGKEKKKVAAKRRRGERCCGAFRNSNT